MFVGFFFKVCTGGENVHNVYLSSHFQSESLSITGNERINDFFF